MIACPALAWVKVGRESLHRTYFSASDVVLDCCALAHIGMALGGRRDYQIERVLLLSQCRLWRPTASQTELEELGIEPGTSGPEVSKSDHYTTEAVGYQLLTYFVALETQKFINVVMSINKRKLLLNVSLKEEDVERLLIEVPSDTDSIDGQCDSDGECDSDLEDCLQEIDGLIGATQSSPRGRKPIPKPVSYFKPQVPLEKRFDKVAHLPVRSSSRRCAHCSTKLQPHRSKWSCKTCEVALCLNEAKNCFEAYHTM
uniref:Uncharacterized protein n=1 Tax=Timema cristinae TaxID=61476 RepID=A0A7R9H4L3_TIMCR|nr:unnamed protein product [Timema cristinae]